MADKTVQNATSPKARSRSRAKASSDATAHTQSAVAARPSVLVRMPAGLLSKESALARLIDLALFDSPRDAVRLDLRRCALRVTSAQLAECFDSVESVMGKIGVPMAVIVRPEDVRIMQASVDLASKAGRLFAIFTGADSEKMALELLAEVHRVMPPPTPQMATGRGSSAHPLTNVLAKAMR